MTKKSSHHTKKQGEQSFYSETSKVRQANHIKFICLGHCSYRAGVVGGGGGRVKVADGCAFWTLPYSSRHLTD